MAKKRIIPKLQFLNSNTIKNATALVTTVHFDKVVEMGDPISQARIFEAQMADELIFIDISVYRGDYQKNTSLNIKKMKLTFLNHLQQFKKKATNISL